MVKNATNVDYIMQGEDTIFNPIMIENGRQENEDVFIVKENHLLFILRFFRCKKENKTDILLEGWYV